MIANNRKRLQGLCGMSETLVTRSERFGGIQESRVTSIYGAGNSCQHSLVSNGKQSKVDVATFQWVSLFNAYIREPCSSSTFVVASVLGQFMKFSCLSANSGRYITMSAMQSSLTLLENLDR